jgi:hypothetical protein
MDNLQKGQLLINRAMLHWTGYVHKTKCPINDFQAATGVICIFVNGAKSVAMECKALDD